MSLTHEEAKKIMHEAVLLREALNFDEAYKLLDKAKGAFEDLADLYQASECINHIAYTKRLQAKLLLEEGHKLALEALNLTTTNSLKTGSAYRAVISLSSALEMFEQELTMSKKLLEQTVKPANKADIMQFISYAQLRTGDVNTAYQSIQQALSLINEGWETEVEPARSVWKSSILLTKSLIEYNLGKVQDSKQTATLALDVAKQSVSKARILQAEKLIQFLDTL